MERDNHLPGRRKSYEQDNMGGASYSRSVRAACVSFAVEHGEDDSWKRVRYGFRYPEKAELVP